jgi:hypothetical protein
MGRWILALLPLFSAAASMVEPTREALRKQVEEKADESRESI